MADPQDAPLLAPLNPNIATAQRRRKNRPDVRRQPRDHSQIPQKFARSAVADHIGEVNLPTDVPQRIGNTSSEPRDNIVANDEPLDRVHNAVFPGRDSKVFVNQLIEERLEEICGVACVVQVNGRDFYCNHPLVSCDQAGLDRIADALALHNEMRRLVNLHMVPNHQCAAANVINGVPHQDILDYINVRYYGLTDSELREAFNEASAA
ncbi:hypothetical protein BWQ96_06371 [Gracilariopsis chorda]|uniref:Uncharacterized protein n=1 Tax=Gracilariopsis chorda TaxID=448386 RepID=A0A2V3IP91_9FLOR|nr:hypothetical protein BWQ96_06371 [Gracilariopsis chorda]|eukprot:PXF43905.1 hypothetical protein BWQ96_06371 [Gracilariopsis chorda]